MAFIPVPDVAQVALRFTQDGQEVANVFHVFYDGIPSTSTFLDIATVFRGWWDTNLRTVVSTSVTLREIAVTDLSVPSGVGIVSADGLPLQGGNASPNMPNHVTLAVKWATGRTGRSFRGRSFHIGLTEGQVVANNIDNGTVSVLQTAYSKLITDLQANNASLVVVSRYTNNAPRVEGFGTPVGTCVVTAGVDSQRRRLPGRGR